MGQHAEAIVRPGRMALWLAEQMVKDVKPEIFARKPVVGGKAIEANHAAFNFGHLAIYPVKWLGVVGLDPKPVTAPAGFEELFAAGKECRDDPTGKIYPSMQVIMDAFFTSHRTALELLPGIDDAKLTQVNPREGRMREMLPTIGSLLGFYTVAHPMMHLGQVSTWRRCFGLGPVM
jgi:hypothetical protein